MGYASPALKRWAIIQSARIIFDRNSQIGFRNLMKAKAIAKTIVHAFVHAESYNHS
jgi:hypothetical protein